MGELAKEAYCAYGQSTGWKNFKGDPMPSWEELPEPTRRAWRAATDTIAAIVSPLDKQLREDPGIPGH